MVNYYLEEYEKEGLVVISRSGLRDFSYCLTRYGKERRKLLNMEFLEASLDVYNKAKHECINLFKLIKDRGYKELLFYGAGEVCELLLYVLNNIDEKDLHILAIIDDDETKIGSSITGITIIRNIEINNYQYDGILVSSYVHNDTIRNKLLDLGIKEDKIIEFFKGDPD